MSPTMSPSKSDKNQPSKYIILGLDYSSLKARVRFEYLLEKWQNNVVFTFLPRCIKEIW